MPCSGFQAGLNLLDTLISAQFACQRVDMKTMTMCGVQLQDGATLRCSISRVSPDLAWSKAMTVGWLILCRNWRWSELLLNKHTEVKFGYFRFVRQDTCDDIYYNLDIQIKESNLCARSFMGDACRGDSGGGLIKKKEGLVSLKSSYTT